MTSIFEQGSIANLTSSMIGNVFGFKALKSLRPGKICGSHRTTRKPFKAHLTAS